MTVPALPLTLTTAGLARFTAAQVEDDIDLTVATVAVSATAFVAAPTLTAIPGEIKRIATISGEPVGDDVVHMIVRDDTATTYTVRGFGLVLADGTLFAVYSQADPICEKSALSTLLFAIDMAFPTSSVSQLTFGDTNFLDPPATSDTAGVVRLATEAEAIAGTAANRVPSVLRMAQAFAAWLGTALDTRLGAGAPTNWAKSLLAAATAAAGRTALGLGAAATKAADFYVAATRQVSGGGLVTGGGALDADRTLTVTAATLAEAKAGTRNDVVITPATAAGAAVPVSELGESGRRVHADGYIELWGVYAGPISSEGARAIVFDTPFPTACVGIEGTIRNTGSTGTGDTQIQEVSVSTAGATVYVQGDSGMSDAAGGFRWKARGY